MSNTKTEAQRLADELVHEATKRVCNVAMMPYSLPIDAAKELRRLDAENQVLREANDSFAKAQDKLFAVEVENKQIKKHASSVRSHLVDSLAFALCEKDGNDDPHHLIWEGGAVPGPWGEVWQKYLPDAEALVEAVFNTATDFGLAFDQAEAQALDDAIAERDQLRAQLAKAVAIIAARQALATTEPEPTGMPEVKPWDHPEPQTMRWSDLEIRWIQSYGEQCWKAGYKHGAWGGDKQTSKQPLQVEPAVNQQLTTEPVDERVAFEKWVTRNGESPNNAVRSCLDPDRYANFDIQGLWEAWQARAAMAKGVK